MGSETQESHKVETEDEGLAVIRSEWVPKALGEDEFAEMAQSTGLFPVPY